MKRTHKTLNRRDFLHRGMRAAGLCALGRAAWNNLSATAAQSPQNPFAYEIDRFSTTDRQLVKYELFKTIQGIQAEPRRIAIGPQDRLYVATRQGVQILDAEGNSLAPLTVAMPARCVAVADDGLIYVGMRTQVEVFDAKGRSQAVWEPPTRKTWLTGLTVGVTDLFAADSANRVVFRYDRSGKVLQRIGEKNLERNIAGFIVPSPYLDVKLGQDGLLRVNNPGRHRVEVYSTGGDLEFAWGRPSAAMDGFCGCCNPIGLAVLRDGRCVTCEKGLPRVKVYSAERTLDCVVAGPELFPQNGQAGRVSDRSDGTLGGVDAAIDSKGNIYILDLAAGDIKVMRPKA